MVQPNAGEGLARWIREQTVLPVGEQEWMDRVCRPLSLLFEGARVWLEIPRRVRCGLPQFPETDFKNGSASTLSWTVRRSLHEGRQVFWIQLDVPDSVLAFSLDAVQAKDLGASRIEGWLLAAALHLGQLLHSAELTAQIQMRDHFMAIASHELKTPLTAIYGMVQLQERMLRSKPWPLAAEELRSEQERHLSYSRIVLKQIERLTALIDGLLDLTRIRAGRFSVEPIPVDAARAIRELDEGRLQQLAHDAGVELVVELPERLPARLDPLRFDEAVTNLVVQAVRRSPEGGQVRLSASGASSGELVLSVSDQGPSLERAARERCFEPFAIEVGGLGLGLYLARQIARLHEGEVRFIDGAPGRGNRIEAIFRGRPLLAAPDPRPDTPAW